MKWISIEDKLPESPSWVLVYADGAINCMGYQDGVWIDWVMSQMSNIVIDDISHWMPLPDRPEDVSHKPQLRKFEPTPLQMLILRVCIFYPLEIP